MRCGCLVTLIGLALSSTLLRADDAPSPLPHWIWTSQRGAAGKLQFARSITLDAAPLQSTLQVAGDFCSVEVRINDVPVLELEDYSPIAHIDVTPWLATGENAIRIDAVPSDGPSAVALSLALAFADGRRERFVTDEHWEQVAVRPRPVAVLGSVDPGLWGAEARSIEISPFDNYEQWRQAIGAAAGSERYWTAPGFEIELVRAAAEDEGSWVALAFDPQGRVTIAREDRGLLRMAFDQPGGAVTSVETIDDTLLECRGLLYVEDDLYANANNSKGTFLLKAGEDESLASPQLLREFPGTVGHGRNQLARGPDGRIYSICGDAVDLPDGLTDRTSPLRHGGRPHPVLEGFVVAFDPHSDQWELCSGGTRNPFGIAFNRDGEAFTYDADAEFDMGSPWYRPTRLLHLVSGADFGWRSVTGQWPPYDPDRPDNALPVLDIGKGSPTAVDFGYDSRFPPRYREALYILDWAYGRVLAVHLQPRGAGYVASAETFLQGQPLNVCGIDFGPDGAMYLVTGGRKTKSGLYRVRWTGMPASTATTSPGDGDATVSANREEPGANSHAAASALHADKARELRRQLEAFHGQQHDEAVATAWPYLDSPDPVLRYAARTAVEHQPVETWRSRALGERRITASLTALMMLARAADPANVEPIIDRATRYNYSQLTTSQRLTLLHLYQLCRHADSAVVERRTGDLLAQFSPRTPIEPPPLHAVSCMGDGARVEREQSRLLVQLDPAAALETCLARLLSATTQADQLHYLFLLRDIEADWTPDQRRVYFTALRETSQYQGGDGMPGFLKSIRDAAIASLSADEQQMLGALLEESPAPEPLPEQNRAVVERWTLDSLEKASVLDQAAGDAARGAEIFTAALCSRCHRAGATGPAVGPDLTYVGRRFSRRDILESILTPSQVVAENYRNLEVVTTDGRVLTGRPVTSGDYRLPVLKLAVDPLRPGEIVEIPKEEVELHILAESSPMPNGLLDTFTAAEIADLLAFLQSGQPPTR